MKTWPTDASRHFESWLGRVRLSMAGDPSLNADDITHDLRAHVHAELEGSDGPVTVGALDRVLNSLGNPTQWSEAGKPPRQPPPVRFYTGASETFADWQQKLAGEWGIPAMLLLVTIVGILTFDDIIGVPLLLFAYFMARSQVTYAADRLVGARKGIVYFPLAVGSGVLVGLVLGFPLTFDTVRGPNQFEHLWILGSWWILVGLLAAREPKRVRSALKPFAETFDSSHGRMLSMVGLAFLIASSVVLIAR